MNIRASTFLALIGWTMGSIAVIMYLLGALGLPIIRRRGEWRSMTLMISVSALVWITLQISLFLEARSLQLSVWTPQSLFQSVIVLAFDAPGLTLSAAVAVVVLAVSLTAVARPGSASMGVRILILVYSALTILAIQAGNLLSVIMLWAFMDITAFVYLLAIVEDFQSVRSLIIRIAVDGAGLILILFSVMLESLRGGSLVSMQGLEDPGAVGILALAGMLRLGLLPLHFSLPALPGVRKGLGTLVRLFPPVIVMAMFARHFGDGVPQSAMPWLIVGGLLGVTVGGVRWLFHTHPLSGRPFFVLCLSGLGILVALLNPARAEQAFVATGCLLLLVGAVISLLEPYQRLFRWLAGVTVVVMLGLAWGPGASLWGTILEGMTRPEQIGLAIPAVVGMLVLLVGLLRLVFLPEIQWPVSERAAQYLYAAGLVLPLISAPLIWVRYNLPVQLLTVIGSLIGLGLVVILSYGLRRVSVSEIGIWQSRLMELDPSLLYGWIARLIGWMLRVSRATGAVLEGESALLWTFVVLLLFFVLIR